MKEMDVDSATLVVTVFLESEAEAMSALDGVRRAVADDGISMVGAAIVTAEKESAQLRLHIGDQSNDAEERRCIEKLFPPAVRALPAVGPGADGAAEYYASIGADTNLLKELGENLSPSGAALIIVVSERWLRDIAGFLRPAAVVRFPLYTSVG